MKKLSVITCTGARPEAFKICNFFMERQTLGREQWEWIIIDDGERGAPVTAIEGLEIHYRRRLPFWSRGQNTLFQNLEIGIQHCQGEFIAFIEDDDWYRENYLEVMLNKAEEGYKLVGEANTKYYHIPTYLYREMLNDKHASLCQTVMHKDLVEYFLRLLKMLDNPFVDIALWEHYNGEKFLFPTSRYSMGIKGLPGREGISSGHRPRRSYWKEDTMGDVLEQWIGEDMLIYKDFLLKRTT